MVGLCSMASGTSIFHLIQEHGAPLVHDPGETLRMFPGSKASDELCSGESKVTPYEEAVLLCHALWTDLAVRRGQDQA